MTGGVLMKVCLGYKRKLILSSFLKLTTKDTKEHKGRWIVFEVYTAFEPYCVGSIHEMSWTSNLQLLFLSFVRLRVLCG